MIPTYLWLLGYLLSDDACGGLVPQDVEKAPLPANEEMAQAAY